MFGMGRGVEVVLFTGLLGGVVVRFVCWVRVGSRWGEPLLELAMG